MFKWVVAAERGTDQESEDQRKALSQAESSSPFTAAIVLPIFFVNTMQYRADATLKVFENLSSSVPASLLYLANELLLSIADCLESERSINAFACTNRRLYLVLNNYLYKQNAVKAESSALQWAAKCGQESSAALSIAQGGNVNVRSNVPPKFRPLFRAVYNTSIAYEAHELVRRNGASSYTPLYVSSMMGHVKVVSLLIENGADTESPLGPWATPLQAASQCGQLQVVRLLVAKRAAIDKPAPHNGRTSLHTACLEGNSAIVQVLIDAGANVMARDSERDTPLHSALKADLDDPLSKGHSRAVQWLLISGADTQARNRKGETPFKLAMQKSSDVKCLFKKGASITVYEASSRAHLQPEHDEKSLQRRWAAYLDRQTEAATEAARAKRLQGEAAAREQLTNQRLRLQRERKASLREAENRKQVAERARWEEEERSKSLRAQWEEQRAKETSIGQKQDAVRKAWFDMRQNAECISKEAGPVAKRTSISCQHASLTWNRRKIKGDCAFCCRVCAKGKSFQCPDCGTVVCQSCTIGRESPG